VVGLGHKLSTREAGIAASDTSQHDDGCLMGPCHIGQTSAGVVTVRMIAFSVKYDDVRVVFTCQLGGFVGAVGPDRNGAMPLEKLAEDFPRLVRFVNNQHTWRGRQQQISSTRGKNFRRGAEGSGFPNACQNRIAARFFQSPAGGACPIISRQTLVASGGTAAKLTGIAIHHWGVVGDHVPPVAQRNCPGKAMIATRVAAF